MKGKRKHGIQRFANSPKIKAALVASGLTQADFAQLVGVSQQVVSATINGLKHSPPVLEKLREMGVPEKFLCDPRKTTQAA